MPSQTRSAATIYSSDYSGGGVANAWTNTSNAATANDVYAECATDEFTYTEALCFEDFGFTLPSGVNIVGLEVIIHQKCDDDADGAIDGSVAAYLNGDPTTWYGFDPVNGQFQVFDTEATDTLGDAASLYDNGGCGGTAHMGLNGTTVNSAGFGVFVEGIASVGDAANIYQVDYLEVTVHYEASITGPAGIVFGGAGTLAVPLSASGGIVFGGSSTITAPLTASAGLVFGGRGNMPVEGGGAVVISVPDISGTGTAPVTGTGDVPISVPTIDGFGLIPYEGGGAVAITVPSISGIGTLPVTGEGAVAISVPSIQGIGRKQYGDSAETFKRYDHRTD